MVKGLIFWTVSFRYDFAESVSSSAEFDLADLGSHWKQSSAQFWHV